MAEWIEGVKCVHSITCGIMLSLLLGLAIQSHIKFSGSNCDITGLNVDKGNFKCTMTSERIWNLGIFYGGAAVFVVGTIATCMSNGYLVIFYLLCACTWLSVTAGLSFHRMSKHDMVLIDGLYSVFDEFILSSWGTWSTVIQWVLGISLIVTLTSTVVMVFHFLQYKYV